MKKFIIFVLTTWIMVAGVQPQIRGVSSTDIRHVATLLFSVTTACGYVPLPPKYKWPFLLCSSLYHFDALRNLLVPSSQSTQSKPMPTEDPSELESAIRTNNMQRFSELLPLVNLNPTNCYRTPLSTAVQCEHIEMIEKLLEFGANVNLPNQDKQTALHEAMHQKNIIVIQLLLKAGANINAQDQWKDTPLHIIVRQIVNYPPAQEADINILAELLKNKPQLDLKDVSEKTVIDLAMERGNTDILKKILQAGSSLDFSEKTLLGIAIRTNHIQSVQYALSLSDTNVDQKTKEGSTFLHLAAQYKVDQQIIKLLVYAGATINAPNAQGQSVIEWCVAQGDMDMFKALLPYSGCTNETLAQLCNPRGNGLALCFNYAYAPLSLAFKVYTLSERVHALVQAPANEVKMARDKVLKVRKKYCASIKFFRAQKEWDQTEPTAENYDRLLQTEQGIHAEQSLAALQNLHEYANYWIKKIEIMKTDDNECKICTDKYQRTRGKQRLKACENNHYLCRTCFEELQKEYGPKCPHCRQPLSQVYQSA